MNRVKAMTGPLRLINSLQSRSYFKSRHIRTQVTQFFTPLPSSLSNHSLYDSHLLNIHHHLYFSTTPNSVIQLVMGNDWSSDLEHELENECPKLTHEFVVFSLKKLEKDPLKAFNFFNWVCGRNGFTPTSPLYSIMLRILVSKDSMKQFWITLKTMKEQGFYIDEETYQTILGVLKREKMNADVASLTHFFARMVKDNAMDGVAKKVVGVVLGKDWNDEVEKELGGMEIAFSDNFVIRVLKELRNQPLKALSFFRWVGLGSDYKHNTTTYNAIVRVLGRSDSISEFWKVVEEMKSVGHEIDIDTYIKISRQLQKSKMLKDSVKLYEFMMDGPFKPSIQHCSMLLRSISGGENPDLDLVFRVVKKYKAAGHTPSKAMYDGVHRSLTSVGQFNEAEKIVNVMRNAGYEPDNITYSQLVFGLCKAKRLEEACRVLDEMEENGCVPDIKTWTILIQGHCASNEVDKALICFAKMVEKNLDIDADLLDVLINGFLQQKGTQGAYLLLVEMVKKTRVRPWQATYKLLIEKLLAVRKLEEAMELLYIMKKQNHPPYPEPFVKYISKFGSVDDGVEFLKALSVKEYPSISAYQKILESFLEEGRQSEAKDLLFKCPLHVRQHSEIGKLFGSSKSAKTAA